MFLGGGNLPGRPAMIGVQGAGAAFPGIGVPVLSHKGSLGYSPGVPARHPGSSPPGSKARGLIGKDGQSSHGLGGRASFSLLGQDSQGQARTGQARG